MYILYKCESCASNYDDAHTCPQCGSPHRYLEVVESFRDTTVNSTCQVDTPTYYYTGGKIENENPRTNTNDA